MKRFALTVLAVLALLPAAYATSTAYTNNGSILVPPQQPTPVIDANSFINNGFFSVTPGYYINSTFFQTVDPFDFSNVQNYTNKGKMISPSGFRFDNSAANYATNGYQTRTRSRYFVNGNNTSAGNSAPASSATISIETGGILSANELLPGQLAPNHTLMPTVPYASIKINATNVISHGQILVPNTGYMEVYGDYIDFSRSFSQVGSLGQTDGFISSFWGGAKGQNSFVADKLPGSAASQEVPSVAGTNFVRINGVGYYNPYLPVPPMTWPSNLLGDLTQFKLFHTDVPTTNKTVQAIFVHNVNPEIGVEVGGLITGPAAANDFINAREFGLLQVLFTGAGTNLFGVPVVNSLLIEDALGSDPATATNAYPAYTGAYGGLLYRPSRVTPNYSVTRYTAGLSTLADINLAKHPALVADPALTDLTVQDTTKPYSVTNLLSTNTIGGLPPLTIVSNYTSRAYAVTVSNIVYQPTPPSNIRDLSGSLRIEADKSLDLNFARLDSPDYIKLSAPHFLGSTNALIGAAFEDIFLGSTNGSLTLTNLIRRGLPQLNGTVSMVSLMWTNFQAYRSGEIGFTQISSNRFTVLTTNAPLVTQDVITLVSNRVFNGVEELNTTISNVDERVFTNAPPLNNQVSKTNFTIITVTTNILVYPVPTHVLFVEANLQTTFPNRILQMALTCTNRSGATNTVNVGDDFFIMEGFKLDADILNVFDTGKLDFQQTDFNWFDQVPYLRSITNNGVIAATNTANGLYFSSRNRVTGDEQPLDNFVNTSLGELDYNGGAGFRANYFENSGFVYSINSFGPLVVDAGTVLFGDGGLTASRGGDFNISCTNFVSGDHVLVSDRALNLSVYGSATAAPVTPIDFLNDFSWFCGDGANLLVKPATGDFNNIILYSYADDYAEVFHQWAGLDVGANVVGFTDNGSLGILVLDGGLFSRFTFQPVGESNALYVDEIDLYGSAVDTDLDGNYTGVDIKPGFTIYFDFAYDVDFNDISDTLDGKYGVYGSAGGKFVRIPQTSGRPQSKLKSKRSPIGILTRSSGIEPAVSKLANGNRISWNTVKGAQSNVYFKSSLRDAHWQLIHTSVSTATGRTTFTGSSPASGGFYKVEVSLMH